MPDLASFLVMNAVVPASGAATAMYIVPRGDTWELSQVSQQATSQSCQITDIRDSRGFHYGNISPANPLPLNTFQQLGQAGLGMQALPFPLHLEGDTVFYIDFKDTSAAQNTVSVIFAGKRTTGVGA